mgnify:CR=1 FL=1
MIFLGVSLIGKPGCMGVALFVNIKKPRHAYCKSVFAGKATLSVSVSGPDGVVQQQEAALNQIRTIEAVVG